MDNTLILILERIFLSKKLFFAAVPVIATAFASFAGYDPAAQWLIVLDAVFAGLLVIQGLLDLRFGSASDGTTPVVVVAPDAVVVPTDTASSRGNTSRTMKR